MAITNIKHFVVRKLFGEVLFLDAGNGITYGIYRRRKDGSESYITEHNDRISAEQHAERLNERLLAKYNSEKVTA